jgi:hypothetical protein
VTIVLGTLVQMTLLLHGETGGWDELLIALVAVGVLWIAVKLAGRKPAAEDEDDPLAAEQATVDVDREHKDPVPPSASKLG